MATQFDIVIYGASGFTGRLALAYLRQHYPELRLAVAGRSSTKLKAVAGELPGQAPEIIVAGATDAAALQTMAAQCKVIANFAGPYALYGQEVVKAAVAQGCHYCDITGETAWAARMIEAYHEQACATHATLIPFAGFDSVPADLMSSLAWREAKAQGIVLDHMINTYQIKAGLNGGTLASALLMAENEGSFAGERGANNLLPKSENPKTKATRTQPSYLPTLKSWTVPFVMNDINAAVVRRSTYLRRMRGDDLPYFEYEERMPMPGRLSAHAAALASSLGTLGLKTKLGRELARRLGPKPGNGLAANKRQHCYYRGRLLGSSMGRDVVQVDALAAGDPSNEITVTLAAEIAVLLASTADLQHARGFTTASVAFAGPLLTRLAARGISFVAKILP